MFELRFRSLYPMLAVGSALVLLVAGCVGHSQLAPAPGDTELGGNKETAVSSIDSVDVNVFTKAWNGRQEILNVVTPLRIEIKNNSDQPVRVRYSDFKLVGPKGKTYAALPPYGITGSVEEPHLVQVYPAIVSPDFDWDDFDVAPYYAPIYPDIPVWDGPFYYDPFYYDQYYTYWQQIELPTHEMLNEALPDGVIKPGGRVSGFLYFQEVDDKLPRVRFEYDLVNASNGNIFGTITIPLLVERKY
jgi:hypothetical protein